MTASMQARQHDSVPTVSRGLSPIVFRQLQDVLQSAEKSYWLRRAAIFDACGTASAELKAQACRNRSQLCEYVLEDSPAVIAALDVFWAEIFERLHVLTMRDAAINRAEAATTVDEIRTIWRDADRGGYLNTWLRSKLILAAREIQQWSAVA